jgi:hypothetical protein
VKQGLSASIVDQLKVEVGGNRRRGRAMFLANLEDIEQGIAAGFPAKDLWQKLKGQGKLSISYNQFLIYTRELVTKTSPDVDEKNTKKIKPVITVSEPVHIKTTVDSSHGKSLQETYVELSSRRPEDF